MGLEDWRIGLDLGAGFEGWMGRWEMGCGGLEIFISFGF